MDSGQEFWEVLLKQLGVNVPIALGLAPWAGQVTQYVKRTFGKRGTPVNLIAVLVAQAFGAAYTLAVWNSKVPRTPFTLDLLYQSVLLGAAIAIFAILLKKGEKKVPDRRPVKRIRTAPATKEKAQQ